MTGLISIPQPESPEGESTVIENDGWFPDIDPAEARLAERITTTITPERLQWAITNAMLSVNDELTAWRQAMQAAGSDSMAAIEQVQIGGVGKLVRLYRRAVYSLAHADLIERYPDYSMTRSGAAHSEALAPAGDDHYRNARWAMSDILGVPRTTVELI